MMEKLLIEAVEQFAREKNIEPSTVLQRSVKAGGTEWLRLKSGEITFTVRKSDRVLSYIRKHSNPPKKLDWVADV